MIGKAPLPKWLSSDGLLSHFGKVRSKARQRYRKFVLEGLEQDIWKGLRQQIYLGDEKIKGNQRGQARHIL